MSKQIDAIRGRNERVRSLYGSGSAYNDMTPVVLDLMISASDVFELLAKIDADAKVIADLDERLIKAKDWSTHYFAETIRIEKLIAEGHQRMQKAYDVLLTEWDAEHPQMVLINEWLKKVGE